MRWHTKTTDACGPVINFEPCYCLWLCVYFLFYFILRTLPFDKFLRRAAQSKHDEFFFEPVSTICTVTKCLWQLSSKVGFKTLHCGWEYDLVRFAVAPCVNLFWVVLVLKKNQWLTTYHLKYALIFLRRIEFLFHQYCFILSQSVSLLLDKLF